MRGLTNDKTKTAFQNHPMQNQVVLPDDDLKIQETKIVEIGIVTDRKTMLRAKAR